MQRWARDGALALALSLMAMLIAEVAVRDARPLLVDFGPTDVDYVSGFRQDAERDGRTTFRWTSPAANVRLPLRISGEGPVLRIRLRRHFVDPAVVRLIAEGRTVSTFEIQADPKVAYRVHEVTLGPVAGNHAFVLSIETASAQPLGVALDWMELERRPGTRFAFIPGVLLRFGLSVLLAFLLPRLGGLGVRASLAHALLLIGAGAWGSHTDALAFARVLLQGAGAYATVGILAVAVARTPRWSSAHPGWARGALVALVLAALAVRLGLLLHPRFYYPDVRVHASFALLLARRGFLEFGSQFIESQYRWSLGLQQIGSHWYAMPYPPGFYACATPLIVLFGYRPEAAVAVVAAAVNSLETLVVYAIAAGLELGTATGLAASAAVPLLPLFLARLSLAYFPALFGHFFDAILLAYLFGRLRPGLVGRSVGALAALVALSLLAYTQSAINIVVFGACLAALGPFRRDLPRLAVSVLLGAAASLGLFYWRYVPVAQAIQANRPLPQERVLLERFAQEERARILASETTVPEDADPFTGDGFEALRGIRKAAWRLWVFYGGFAPVVLLGFAALLVRLGAEARRACSAWALTYVVLNFLSGSLAGPNLLRYNKDLEVVAPLACLCLGAAAIALSRWRGRLGRGLAFALGAAWLAFGVLRATQYLSERMFLER